MGGVLLVTLRPFGWLRAAQAPGDSLAEPPRGSALRDCQLVSLIANCQSSLPSYYIIYMLPVVLMLRRVTVRTDPENPHGVIAPTLSRTDDIGFGCVKDTVHCDVFKLYFFVFDHRHFEGLRIIAGR